MCMLLLWTLLLTAICSRILLFRSNFCMQTHTHTNTQPTYLLSHSRQHTGCLFVKKLSVGLSVSNNDSQLQVTPSAAATATCIHFFLKNSRFTVTIEFCYKNVCACECVYVYVCVCALNTYIHIHISRQDDLAKVS